MEVIWAAVIGACGVIVGGVLTLAGAHFADRRAVLRERERIAAETKRASDARLFEYRRETIADFLGMYERYSDTASEIEQGLIDQDAPEDFLSPMWRSLGMIEVYFPRDLSDAAKSLLTALSNWLYESAQAPPGDRMAAAEAARDRFATLASRALGATEQPPVHSQQEQ